ncbi:hypothetical protein PENVUL_c141G04513, partial [Penicillium vulpinum]
PCPLALALGALSTGSTRAAPAGNSSTSASAVPGSTSGTGAAPAGVSAALPPPPILPTGADPSPAVSIQTVPELTAYKFT